MHRAYYKQNRCKQLQAFCLTALSESMSRAGTQMALSQPSISLLIQALEKDLACQLFVRRGPRIRLTNEGRALLDLALPLVEGLQSLPDALHERCRSQITGNLNIAAGESTTMYLLPPVVREFASQYPQVSLTLHNATGGAGVAMVRAGKVDFAVGPIGQVPDDMLYAPIVSYEPVLILPPGHALARKKRLRLSDLAPYGLILPPAQMSTRETIDMVFRQNNVKYNMQMEAGGWEVIKKYVETGLGIAIVTSICLTGKERLVTRPLTEYFPRRSYGMILRRGKFISPAARKFIEILDTDGLLKTSAAVIDVENPMNWYKT